MIQTLQNITNSWIFNEIGRNCLLVNRKKIAKFLMRTFTCCSTFLYDWNILCQLNRIFVSVLSRLNYWREECNQDRYLKTWTSSNWLAEIPRALFLVLSRRSPLNFFLWVSKFALALLGAGTVYLQPPPFISSFASTHVRLMPGITTCPLQTTTIFSLGFLSLIGWITRHPASQ